MPLPRALVLSQLVIYFSNHPLGTSGDLHTALNTPDTGEEKKKLALSLGAEKWVDFKESQNVVADVQAATGGLGPQVAIITSNDVSLASTLSMAATKSWYRHERLFRLRCISRTPVHWSPLASQVDLQS